MAATMAKRNTATWATVAALAFLGARRGSNRGCYCARSFSLNAPQRHSGASHRCRTEAGRGDSLSQTAVAADFAPGGATDAVRDRLQSVDERVDSLTRHHASWDPSLPLSKSSARTKLRRRHLRHFTRQTAFDEFAAVVCEAGVTARKEVFETWAAALYIDEAFPAVRRVADVAAGHGLLAWALLLLDDERWGKRSEDTWGKLGERECESLGENECLESDVPPPRTVLCVDRRMTSQAEAIENVMLVRYPHLKSRFDFVEGRVEQLSLHPSCLIVSVHACGSLSDLIVSLATEAAAPLSLMPCCHSRKRLQGVSPFAWKEYLEIMNADEVLDLPERLDEVRIKALENAGFTVQSVFLPEAFTAKNNLILANPSGNGPREIPTLPAQEILCPVPSEKPRIELHRSGRISPGISSRSNMTTREKMYSQMTIPCEDTHKGRIKVNQLAGRAAAERRQRVLHAKGQSLVPQLDVSFWLPPTIGHSDDKRAREVVTGAALSALAGSIDPRVRCEASQHRSDFINSSGRTSKTFRMRYIVQTAVETEAGGAEYVDPERAKEIHKELNSRIPLSFPGTECR